MTDQHSDPRPCTASVMVAGEWPANGLLSMANLYESCGSHFDAERRRDP
jgi:hypothetical protein